MLASPLQIYLFTSYAGKGTPISLVPGMLYTVASNQNQYAWISGSVAAIRIVLEKAYTDATHNYNYKYVTVPYGDILMYLGNMVTDDTRSGVAIFLNGDDIVGLFYQKVLFFDGTYYDRFGTAIIIEPVAMLNNYV